MCQLLRGLGASPSWNPHGPSRPLMVLLYRTFRIKQKIVNIKTSYFWSLCSFLRPRNTSLTSVPLSVHPLHCHLLSRNFLLFLLTCSPSLPSPVRTTTLLQDQWLPLDHFPLGDDRCSDCNVPTGSRRFLRNADPLTSYTASYLLHWELEVSWRYDITRMVWYDMISLCIWFYLLYASV